MFNRALHSSLQPPDSSVADRSDPVPGRPLPLSAAIITLNEENNLPRCLESLSGLVSEIVVIDSGSKDRTASIAWHFNAIFEVHTWRGHVEQKNIALRRCTQPWVLCLDADEAVSPELAGTLRRLLGNGAPAEEGFFVNRLNFYLGEWIRHAWYPEWRLRIVRRGHALWGGLNPHDKLEVQGRTRRIEGDLLHYPFESLQDHLETEVKYARIMASSLSKAGHAFKPSRAVFSPWHAFFKVLVLRGGWRDGWRGWVIASARWAGTFAKHAFLLEKERGWDALEEKQSSRSRSESRG